MGRLVLLPGAVPPGAAGIEVRGDCGWPAARLAASAVRMAGVPFSTMRIGSRSACSATIVGVDADSRGAPSADTERRPVAAGGASAGIAALLEVVDGGAAVTVGG